MILRESGMEIASMSSTSNISGIPASLEGEGGNRGGREVNMTVCMRTQFKSCVSLLISNKFEDKVVFYTESSQY